MRTRNKKPTVDIRVGKETWSVPRGFGVDYSFIASIFLQKDKYLQACRDLQTILLLVGYRVTITVVDKWTLRQKVERAVWANNAHLRASDNAIPRHPRLTDLPQPWTGGFTGNIHPALPAHGPTIWDDGAETELK